MLSVKHWLIFHEGKSSFRTLYLPCILTWFITVTVSELRNILTEKMKLIQLYFRSQNFCEIELSQSKNLSKHNYNLKIPIFTFAYCINFHMLNSTNKKLSAEFSALRKFCWMENDFNASFWPNYFLLTIKFFTFLT